MGSYRKISYTDVVNQVRENGWSIESQTPDATIITRQKGAPRIPAIVISFIPLIGVVIAVAWIAIRGSITVTIERKLTSARVLTPRNEYDINTRDDMELFFNDYSYANGIGYYTVLLIGGAVLFGGFFLYQLMRGGVV